MAVAARVQLALKAQRSVVASSTAFSPFALIAAFQQEAAAAELML
jgi:hypothetical protein